MRARRARRPVAALLVLTAVVVAGCSGDDDDVGTASNDASASSVTVDSSGSTVAAATAPNATGGTTAASTGASTAAATETTVAAAATAPGATGQTSGPAGGNGPLATRDLAGQDLCPVLGKDDVSTVVGVPIGLAESNPSYRDPNCVYYKAEAGQAVSVTKAPAASFDQQGAQDEAVSGVGDQAKWSSQQLTLFVKAKDATLVVSVYQVGQAGGEKAAAVAVAQKVIANL